MSISLIFTSVAQVAMELTDPNSALGFLNSKIAEVTTLLGTAGTAVVIGFFIKRVLSTGFAIAGMVAAALVGMLVLYMIRQGMGDGSELIEKEVNGAPAIVKPVPAASSQVVPPAAAGPGAGPAIDIRVRS